jgi:anti-sigma-K factor RskA
MVSHCDDEELSLMALGETAGAADEEHLAACLRCQDRLAQYSATVALARAITDADRPVDPPPGVWAGIAAELGMTGTSASTPVGDTPENLTPITSARSRRSTWLIAVAAAAIGVALGAVVTFGMLSPKSSQQLVASAALGPIDESGLSGTATIEEHDGQATLTVSVPELPGVPDGYYEVWMATADTTTMVSIGTLNPGQEATFTLPSGMDVGSFPVVDVSVEHFDGNAAHSATSIVRGTLQA